MTTGTLTPKELQWVMRQTSDRRLVAVDNFSNQLPAERNHTRRQNAGFWLAAIVNSSTDAIISEDLDGLVTSWNKAAEAMFGYTADEIIGKPVSLIIPPDRAGEDESILERVWQGERIRHIETRRQSKDGTIMTVSLTESPICDDQGRIIGATEEIVYDLAHTARNGSIAAKTPVMDNKTHEKSAPLSGFLAEDVAHRIKRAGQNQLLAPRTNNLVSTDPERDDLPMEPAYWFAMWEICGCENITEAHLIGLAQDRRPDLPPAAAVQLEILQYLRKQAGVLQPLDVVAMSHPPQTPVNCLATSAVITLHVLVVDDVAMNRDLAGCFLRAAGHKVSCLGSGKEAIAAVEATDFDVVLMDVRMPEMDGLEATRRIRALQGPRGRVPIVALTARAFTEQVAECREAGMDSHVPKPFGPEMLVTAVLQAFAATLPLGTFVASDLPVPDEASTTHSSRSEQVIFDQTAFERTTFYLTPEAVNTYLKTIAEHSEALVTKLQEPNALIRAGDAICEAACTIAGNAGMFGFERITSLARGLERAIQFRHTEAPALAEALCAALKLTLNVIHDRNLIKADMVYEQL